MTENGWNGVGGMRPPSWLVVLVILAVLAGAIMLAARG